MILLAFHLRLQPNAAEYFFSSRLLLVFFIKAEKTLRSAKLIHSMDGLG